MNNLNGYILSVIPSALGANQQLCETPAVYGLFFAFHCACLANVGTLRDVSESKQNVSSVLHKHTRVRSPRLLRAEACCLRIVKLYKTRALPGRLLTTCANDSFMSCVERRRERAKSRRMDSRPGIGREEGQATAAVASLGAVSVLTWDFNERDQ